MKAKTKLAVLLSDLHVGSTVGLWPEGVVSCEGYSIGQNRFQQILWTQWQECREWIASIVGDDEFETVVNGDLVDGIHHKTLQVMSPDVGDQLNAVIKTLGPLASDSKALYITKGTEVHTRNDELRIGSALGAVQDPSTGHHAWDKLELEFGKWRFSASHHCTTTGRPWLESAEYSRIIGSEVMEQARHDLPAPHIIHRAHRHCPGIFNDHRRIAIVTGAWQGLTRFGRKVVPHALPVPTCVILDFRDHGDSKLPTVHENSWLTQ